MNTPIRYYGGKGNFANEILKYFPSKDDFNTYIEPFGGSYTIGLKLEKVPEIEIYNDLENNVYSLYKVLSDPILFQEFKEKCDLVPYAEVIRNEFKEYLKLDNLTTIQRAFYFFYVNWTSHNGNGGFSKNPTIRRGMSKSISDFLSAIDRLPELHNRLSKIIVSNTDGIELIKKYQGSNIMIYCDPPYEQSTRSSARYSVDMDRKGHEKFLSAVIASSSKILISGYDCELYNDLTDIYGHQWKKIQFEVNTTDTEYKPKTKIETIWKNY